MPKVKQRCVNLQVLKMINNTSLNKRLLIIGAGGHGRVVADCAEQLNQYDDIAFLDDCFDEQVQDTQYSSHWSIIGKVALWSSYVSGTDFIVAFGDNKLRLTTHKCLLAGDANLVSIIHPSAVISQYAEIGQGSVVCAGAVVNLDCVIGEACIINTAASVDHDCHIADGVHISPNVSLAGGVNIGELSWLGIGSTIIQYLTLAANCQIGAGSVVISHIEQAGVYVGNPVRKLT